MRGHIAPLATEPLQLGRRKLGVWQAAFNKTLIRPLAIMFSHPLQGAYWLPFAGKATGSCRAMAAAAGQGETKRFGELFEGKSVD